MSKFVQIVSMGLFAAVAAASLYSLAVAAPAGGADGAPQSCEKAFCLVAFF